MVRFFLFLLLSSHQKFWKLKSEYHGVLTLLTPPSPTSRLYPQLGPTPYTVAQSISPPKEIPDHDFLKRSQLSGCWHMDRYYNYNKYFVNNHTTLSLYQKGFINNNIVNKIKRIYWFNSKIVLGSHRTTSKC